MGLIRVKGGEEWFWFWLMNQQTLSGYHANGGEGHSANCWSQHSNPGTEVGTEFHVYAQLLLWGK